MGGANRKPGSNFAVQPQNKLASTDRPTFDTEPAKSKRRAPRSRAKLRQSFHDLVQSTTITYGTTPPPNTTASPSLPGASRPSSAMPRSRTVSFGDDDLDLISSQTASMSLGHSDNHEPLEIIDLSNSPAPVRATAVPTFGQPTQIQSPLVKKTTKYKRDPHDVVFNHQKTKPELHRDLYRSGGGPLKPKQESRKTPNLQMFSSLGETAQPVQYSQPHSANNDQVFYTDPAKAAADLKALLEGGMEDDEEEGEENGEAAKSKEEALEDGTIEGITVKLLPHQVEGVKWMRNRELGPLKRGKVPKGGILADDMGLGKTLQSISLIVTNTMPKPEDAGWKKHFEHIKRATLVVAPLALIRQWETEIKEKIDKEHALKVCVHHGPQRSKDPKALARYDVVITTYQILVSEFGNSKPEGLQVGCFGIHWYRVILDEAHTIKNRNAKATKACCALRAEYRWCLSGTPMQNNLDELQSLVKFLRIQPYDNLAEWRANIDAPMKNGKGHIAIRRLHSLLQCFMKRRTKDILKEEGALVAGGKKALDNAVAKAKKEGKEVDAPKPAFKITERKVVTVETEFSPAERDFYDQLEARADKSLEKMMADKVNYANALVLLLRLRQACNHPRLSEGNIDKDRDALAAETAAPKAAAEDDIDALTHAFMGVSIKVKQCDMCLGDLTRMEVDSGFTRCGGCKDSLDKLNNESSPTQKKPKKKSRVSIVTEEIKIEKLGRRKQRKQPNRKVVDDSDDDDEEEEEEKSEKRKPRGRKIIVDSDDEEEQGSWLVPEDQRQSLGLGKAGGTDDEDAEGGGDDVGSDDSEHPSEADDQGSDLGSFIVNDEEAKPKRRAGSDGDADSDSDNDTFVSVSKVRSSQVTQRSESGSSGDDAASISESELHSGSNDCDSDNDTFPTLNSARLKLMAEQKKKKKAKGDSVMVSAKIREVLSILRKEATEHKFIVFSQFTSMLDLVEPFLRSQPGLKSVRYDGKMDNTSREAALKALRTDPHTRVLLCSLKCGSLGLNLTAATRVIIVEPFWNPFVEEQAIDRVHRLTQTVDVVVYKLTVADTVEARILELQNKKRLLAEMTIEGGMKKNKNALKLGLKEILDLFKHDPRVDDGIKDPGVVGQDVRAAMMAPPKKVERQEHAVFGRRW